MHIIDTWEFEELNFAQDFVAFAPLRDMIYVELHFTQNFISNFTLNCTLAPIWRTEDPWYLILNYSQLMKRVLSIHALKKTTIGRNMSCKHN